MYTFSRQISQRLLELGIDIPDCNVCNGAKKVWKDKNEAEQGNERTHPCPACDNQLLTLSNLLCLLPVIGEKLKDKEDWKEATCEVCENNPCISEYAECGGTWIKCHARRISHIFLSKSEEQAYKEAEEYILKLIK